MPKRIRSFTIMVNTNAPRNPFAHHPLMLKGGVHEKSKSAQRAETRRETKRLARDWSSFLYKLVLYKSI